MQWPRSYADSTDAIEYLDNALQSPLRSVSPLDPWPRTFASSNMYLKELISQGWQSLMRDRMRSTLTMLGIVWGLASVVLLLAYGQGLGGCVLHAFLNMGNNVIVIWPGQTSMQAGGQRAGKKVNYELEDVEAIRDEVPIVRAVSGEIDRDFGFKIGTRVVSHSGARRRYALRADAQARSRRWTLLQRERFRRSPPRGDSGLRGGEESLSGRARRGAARRNWRTGF